MSLPLHSKERVTADLKNSVLARYGLDLTPAFIVDLLDGNPELLEDCQRMHVDTSNREWFINEVANRLGIGPWPLGQDGEVAWATFKSLLRAKLPDVGQRYVEPEDRPEDAYEYRVPTPEEFEAMASAWHRHVSRPRA